MNTFRTLRARFAAIGATVLALSIVTSCGGGGEVGSGGTGAPSTGYSVGTVNGFGSVIVDGVAYDDLRAHVVVETAPGTDTPAEVRLGERVSVAFQQAGVASTIRILTALSGPVAAVPSNGRLTLLGQTVVVSGAGGSGPTTQFGGGYATAADIAVGDSVDVHGVLAQQAGGWVLTATRIDKLGGAPAYLRVTGVIAGAGAGATTFMVGGLSVDATGATIVPAGSTLVDGEAVTLLALPGTYVPSAVPPRLRAAQVRLASLPPSSTASTLSGSISALDASAKTFLLGAQRVSYAGASLLPAGAILANGSYVQVQGVVGADRTLAAGVVDVRSTDTEDSSDLSGTIVSFDGTLKTFLLRGVLVDAGAARLQGCPVGGLANGLYVVVTGTLGSNGVVAATIQCRSEPAGSTIERDGRSSAVDTTARTFTLTPEHGAGVTVQWTDTTFFGNGLTAATLSGKSVNVQGSFVGAVLVATKIKLED